MRQTRARAREGASWCGAARAAAARRDVGTVIAEVRRRGRQSREISRRLPCTCRGEVGMRREMEPRGEAGQSVGALRSIDTDSWKPDTVGSTARHLECECDDGGTNKTKNEASCHVHLILCAHNGCQTELRTVTKSRWQQTDRAQRQRGSCTRQVHVQLHTHPPTSTETASKSSHDCDHRRSACNCRSEAHCLRRDVDVRADSR